MASFGLATLRRGLQFMEMTSAGVYGKPIISGEAFTATDTEKWLGIPTA